MFDIIDSLEGLKASYSSTDNESMDIVSTFISVDCLKIANMSDDVVFIDYTVTSEHISCLSCNVKGLSATVSLYHRDHFWC